MLTLAACNDAELRSASYETAPSLDRPIIGWLSRTPIFTIGQEDSGTAYQFHNIRRVVALSTGSILVATSDSPSIRIFTAAGGLIRGFGERGSGPGEFQRFVDVWFLPPDTIVALDRQLLRATWFSLDGKVLGTVSTAPVASHGVIMGRFEDGNFLVVEQVPTYVERDGYRLANRLTKRVSIDAVVVDTLRSFEEARAYPIRREYEIPFLFPSVGVYVAAGMRLYARYPSTFTIHVVPADSIAEPRLLIGAPTRQAQRSVVDRAIDDEKRADARGPGRKMRLRIDVQRKVGILPQFGNSIVVGPEATVWVPDYDGAHPGSHVAWTVFAENGAVLGSVRMHEAFLPSQISSARIVGVWRDGLGVETVRGYDLVMDNRNAAPAADSVGR